jgi:hypothetical protein
MNHSDGLLGKYDRLADRAATAGMKKPAKAGSPAE